MRNLLKGLLLLLLSLNFACGPNSSSNQTEDSDKTEYSAAPEETDTNDQSTGQEDTKRPSPPRQASASLGEGTITIDYSSPSVKGRTIWGGLVPYGKVWRTGANEATTFEATTDITVEGQALAAGKYALFTIPNEDKWTIIFNSQPDQWGSYDRDEAKDILSVDVSPQTMEESSEALEFVIEGDTVFFRWEKRSVPFKLATAG